MLTMVHTISSSGISSSGMAAAAAAAAAATATKNIYVHGCLSPTTLDEEGNVLIKALLHVQDFHLERNEKPVA